MGSQHCSVLSPGELARRSKFPYKISTARCPRDFPSPACRGTFGIVLPRAKDSRTCLPLAFSFFHSFLRIQFPLTSARLAIYGKRYAPYNIISMTSLEGVFSFLNIKQARWPFSVTVLLLLILNCFNQSLRLSGLGHGKLSTVSEALHTFKHSEGAILISKAYAAVFSTTHNHKGVALDVVIVNHNITEL